LVVSPGRVLDHSRGLRLGNRAFPHQARAIDAARLAAVTGIAGKTLAIATHVFGSGPADALEEYAVERAARVVVVRHAFSYAPQVDSVVRTWQAGKLVHERRLRWNAHVPGPITWTKDLLLDVLWAGRTPGMIDVYVGIDSLNAAAGVFLRRADKARRVIFWTIDYVPQRFQNQLLNRVYHRFDRFCVKRCDVTWNVSPRMEPARRARGIEGPQRVVEMGANVRPPRRAARPRQAIFVGHLLEKQGVQLALRALPLVRERVPGARLLVIGDGPYRSALESLVRELRLEDAVEFAGYVERHEEVEDRIAESAVGLATYDPDMASFTEFADPGKIKNYLAAGVPVVTTPVVHSAPELERSGAGVVIPYRPDALADVLSAILGDPNEQRRRREAAATLGAQSDWTAVFDRAFAGFAARGDLAS
jgi:glycosyltransferase involved in cell wall biosynthesis